MKSSLMGLAFAMAFVASSHAQASDLEIRFIDVGQGDAVLLRDGEHAALVDAGSTDIIVKKLKQLNVNALELFVASHNHDDHIGGADAVLSRMKVGRYLDNGFPAATVIQNKALGLMRSKSVGYATATIKTLMLGETRLRFLVVPSKVAGDPQNNRSVGIIVEHGRFKALLTGDSEVEELNTWLDADVIPDVDVLKAAHHGSRNGVTPLWLHRSKPEVVVISVGAGNEYGHPHEMALKYYEAGGRRVLRTDRDGDVVVCVERDGGYSVKGEAPEKEPKRRRPSQD